MKTAVFTFVKPSPNSVIASVRIAKFIAKTLDVPVHFDERIREHRWDVLILVNGAFSYCASRDDIAVAVRKARRIIWVQNDYMIYAPIPDGEAESTFRKAFRIRRDRGLPDMDHWTTVKEKCTMTDASRYINWNMLTALKQPMSCNRDASGDLFYYGAFRSNRVKTFDRYFKRRKIDLTISSANKHFIERYPHARVFSAIERGSFYDELNSHGLGLYIEDPRSHRQFHSPANRFYEMLSAGLPMVFEPDAVNMLSEAGFDITPFIADNQRDARQMMKRRRTIQRHQHDRWWDDFRGDLTHTLRRSFRRYLKEHF
jgi:hypothetical protein